MRKIYITALLCLLGMGSLSAQSARKAQNLFEQGEFEQAKAIYQQLVKMAPSNAGYNYFYGACCYETGELEKSVSYLEKSAKRKYINAYRYLGKAYFDLYRFEEALENYETHLEWLIKKNRDTEAVEEEMGRIRQGARMIKGVEKVLVVDSFALPKDRFLEAYKLSKSSGSLAKNDETGGMSYTNEMGNVRLMTKADKTGKMQLYSQIKLLKGWGKENPIESLNEMGNVNYPFLMGDGLTLYFSSDGEGSIGGQDIFVTRYASDDNSYLRPDNIGMPFNSLANDYMYAIDEFNQLGWFASDRYQPADSVCVYVFVPNESKVVYNYETTGTEKIQAAASLKSISATWSDADKVQQVKTHLQALLNQKDEADNKHEFTFVVNDDRVYHALSDFRSAKARQLYQQLVLKRSDLKKLSTELAAKRERYATENSLGKKKLGPSILELEKRVPQLVQEVKDLTLQVRNNEIANKK